MTRTTENAASEPRPCGDDLACVAVANPATAQRLAAALRREPEWLEVVPGLDSVTVQFDPLILDPERVCARLRDALPRAQQGELIDDGPVLDVPVRYGGDEGPDLDAVCRQLGLSPADFVAAHTGRVCRVDLMGFTPGFAYVGGLDPALDVPRLSAPRARVPAGAVGIAGTYTGLYALAGPGGWAIVGRTPMPLFDAGAGQPFRLAPGQRIRFRRAGEGGS